MSIPHHSASFQLNSALVHDCIRTTLWVVFLLKKSTILTMVCTAIIQYQYKAPHSYGHILELTVKLNLTMVHPIFAQVQYKSLHIHKCGHFKLGPDTLSTISAQILSEILTVLLF